MFLLKHLIETNFKLLSLINHFMNIAIVTSNRVYKPISISQAVKDVRFYLSATNITKVTYTTLTIFKAIELMENYSIFKQNIYDVIIVATMLENNINKIITVNDKDFSRILE